MKYISSHTEGLSSRIRRLNARKNLSHTGKHKREPREAKGKRLTETRAIKGFEDDLNNWILVQYRDQ